MMLGTAVLSAFLSNTGTIAMLLPAVLVAVWRLEEPAFSLPDSDGVCGQFGRYDDIDRNAPEYRHL